jgi:ribosome-associated protein
MKSSGTSQEDGIEHDEPTVASDWMDGPRGPSKSQLKREKQALQALAERLVSLPRPELERLRLSEATWAAIDETPRIRDPRARGRHWKRIANLLEREDMHAVHALLDHAAARQREDAARHHYLERWRERLIAEGDEALGEFLVAHPDIDRSRLRALVRAAQRDRDRGRPEAQRKLFQYLREVSAAESPDRSYDEPEHRPE